MVLSPVVVELAPSGRQTFHSWLLIFQSCWKLLLLEVRVGGGSIQCFKFSNLSLTSPNLWRSSLESIFGIKLMHETVLFLYNIYVVAHYLFHFLEDFAEA